MAQHDPDLIAAVRLANVIASGHEFDALKVSQNLAYFSTVIASRDPEARAALVTVLHELGLLTRV